MVDHQAHNAMMRRILIKYYTNNNQSCPSLQGFYHDCIIDNIPRSKEQFIMANPHLRQIARGERRSQAKQYLEALGQIQCYYPVSGVGGGGGLSESGKSTVTHELVERARQRILLILDFKEIKCIATSRNFLSATRELKVN